MPLIKCPDCGKECSDIAPTCPNCGRLLQKRKSSLTMDIGCGGVVYFLVVLAGLYLIISNVIEDEPAGWTLGGFIVLIGTVLLAARLKRWHGVGK